MKRKILLAASHISILILAFLGIRAFSSAPEIEKASLSPTIAKPLSRALQTPPIREQISVFRPKREDYYRDLAETLPPPADFPSELAALALEMGDFSTKEGKLMSSNSAQFETLNRFHAHLRNWLLSDKEAFLQYFKQEELKGSDIERMAFLTPPGAISDFLAEDGLINNLAFFELRETWNSTRVLADAFAQEVQKGQSLGLLMDIEEQLGPLSERLASKMIIAASIHLPFQDRNEFVDRLSSNENLKFYGPSYLSNFIFNPAHPPEEVRLWMSELKDSGQLGQYAERVFLDQLCSAETPFSLEERLDIAQQIYPEKAGEVIGRSLNNKVLGFLESERDYRYEFQTGVLTASEILADLRARNPVLFADYSDDIVLSLYTNLAKVRPEAAAAVLDELSDPSRSPLLLKQNES